jgi:hypothetical protein
MVALHLRDLTSSARSAGGDPGRVYGGLSVGMLYQVLLLDRLAMPGLGPAMRPEGGAKPTPAAGPGADSAETVQVITIPIPEACHGHQRTLRVVVDWLRERQDGAGGGDLRLDRGALVSPLLLSPDARAQADAEYLAWLDSQRAARRLREQQAGLHRFLGCDAKPALGFTALPVPPPWPEQSVAQPGADGVVLGQVCLPDWCGDALWLDLAAWAWTGAHWLQLPLRLDDVPTGPAGLCTLVADVDAWAANPQLRVSLHQVQAALASDSCVWALHRSRPGVFIALGLDVSAAPAA